MKIKLLSALVAASVSVAAFSASASGVVPVNVKDGKSSVKFSDYNSLYKVAFGGAGEVKQISQEFFDLFGQDNLKKIQVPLVLEAVLFDKGWSKEHGVEGVTLTGLTDSSFALTFENSQTGVKDTINFHGTDVTALLDTIAASNINIKDNKTRLAVFNPDKDKSSFWIGGGKSDSVKRVSQEFADITGGSKIQGRELKPLLEALLIGKPKAELGGVELLGINSTSFAISVNEGVGRYERILFKGDYVADVIAEVTGAGTRLDTGDGWGKFATWDTDASAKFWLSQGNPALKTMCGHNIEIYKNGNELQKLIAGALSKDGIQGVTVVGVSQDSITLKIQAKGSTVDTLMIKGQAVSEALVGGMS